MLKHLRILFTLFIVCFVALDSTAYGKSVAVDELATYKNGMVSSQEAIASTVGVDILRKGGNAVDAAVATGFALAVTYPRAGNIGGGGFMLVYVAELKKSVAIDYREMAPKAANRDMFLDADGNVDNRKSRFSALSSGVPGTVAGMVYALETYGTMSLAEVIQPAIDLADKGFVVSNELHSALSRHQRRIGKFESTRAVYYPNNDKPMPVGRLFVQKDLAWVLKQIKARGAKGFYEGPVAKKIALDSQKNDGIITEQDLADYKVMDRAPITGTYRNHQVVSMPPPSSGGIHLVQMLNILEHWDIKESKLNSALTINRMVEVMKRAYSDRSLHLGDPDFHDVPVAQLISKRYAKDLYQKISKKQVTPSDDIRPGVLPKYESDQTTHYSVMDKYGNAVANTYTLNASFGNGRVAEGTGILMNNEMDDFSAKSGVPNMFGLIGGEANSIEAGKRPLSSMTPSLVIKDGKAMMATGSVGGSRIITTTLQAIMNVIDHQMDILSATKAPRFHHQWYPDSLVMENGFNPDVINQLRSMGYTVDAPEKMGHSATRAGRNIGFLQSIVFKDGVFTGTADPRRKESLAIGF